MIKRLSLILLAFGGLLGPEAQAQDPHFSQFYANPLYLNPALAGIDKCPRLNLNYRNQYPSLSSVYQTFSASYDQYVDKLNGGVGLMILRDEAANGTLNLTEVSAIYSYHLQITRKFYILAGFQATYRQRAIDPFNLQWPDQIDDFYGFVRPTNEIIEAMNNQHLDLTTGAVAYMENFYLGFAVHHLTEPNEAFLTTYNLPRKYTVHGGATIPLGRKNLHNSQQNKLIPHFVFQQQANMFHITTGVSFNRGPITGGLAVRHGNINPDALVMIFGFSPGGDIPFGIGYSYDYVIGKLTNAVGGAHEISLFYRFPCVTSRKRIKELSCPKF